MNFDTFMTQKLHGISSLALIVTPRGCLLSQGSAMVLGSGTGQQHGLGERRARLLVSLDACVRAGGGQ